MLHHKMVETSSECRTRCPTSRRFHFLILYEFFIEKIISESILPHNIEDDSSAVVKIAFWGYWEWQGATCSLGREVLSMTVPSIRCLFLWS